MQSSNPQRFTFMIFSSVLSLLVTLAAWVPKGDEVFFINGNNTPALDTFFKFATEFGNGFIFLPVALTFIFIRFQYVLITLSAWALHGLLVWMCKDWLFDKVKRPSAVLDKSLLHFIEGVNIHVIDSFPSGHTTTAFCLATILSLLFPNRWFVCLVLIIALMVGYSRIYLLQHFLIDVAGGAVIGTASAIIMWVLFTKITLAPWMSGNLIQSLSKTP